MSRSNKVSILIMREDAGVRRLRVGQGWLKAAVWGLVGLVLACGAAIWGVISLYGASREDAAAVAGLRKEIEAGRERSEKFDAVEKVLRSKDATELQTLIGSYNPDSAQWWKKGEDKKPEAPAAGEKAGEPDCPRIDLHKLLSRVDLNQAGIDNFKAHVDGKRLAVSFDLSNVSPQTALSGRAEVSLIGNDGSQTPLKPDKDELSFQIQRFKQVASSLPLPGKFDQKELYGVRMQIADPAGKIIYSAIFPLTGS